MSDGVDRHGDRRRFAATARENGGKHDPTVTTTAQGIANDGKCSLQEAIYAANFDSGDAPSAWDPLILFGTQACEAGSGDDVIELEAGATYPMTAPLDDPYNPTGPTATPIVLSNITIEGNGAQLVRANPGRDFTGLPNFRAFAVGNRPFVTCIYFPAFNECVPGLDTTLPIPGDGKGKLTLKNLFIKGFTAKGGNGASGGGGGLGAGGAIYVLQAGLDVQNTTFQDNGAGGGNGSANVNATGGGGGGGLGGSRRRQRGGAVPWRRRRRRFARRWRQRRTLLVGRPRWRRRRHGGNETTGCGGESSVGAGAGRGRGR